VSEHGGSSGRSSVQDGRMLLCQAPEIEVRAGERRSKHRPHLLEVREPAFPRVLPSLALGMRGVCDGRGSAFNPGIYRAHLCQLVLPNVVQDRRISTNR
jgi:hypothetical protein